MDFSGSSIGFTVVSIIASMALEVIIIGIVVPRIVAIMVGTFLVLISLITIARFCEDL